MKSSNKKILVRVQYLFILLISAGLLFFVAYKASIASFTHDESYTYLHYVHQKFLDILSFKNPYTNNHILNSILIKYSECLFGSSELSLRLPNILAFLLYLVFTFLLLQKQNRLLILPLFIFFTFNPFLLDFYGLARGYGLSIGLMLMSIYYLLTSFEEQKRNYTLLFFNISAILAVFANFTMLNYYVAALIAFNVTLFLIYKKEDREERFFLLRTNRVNIISILVALCLLFEPIRRLAKVSKLDYGASSLLDTIKSQVYNTFYDVKISGTLRDNWTYFIIAVLLFNFSIIAYSFLREKRSFFIQHKGLLVSNLVVIIILLETIVQHYLFHNDYFKDRFALFLYPLIALNVAFFSYYLFNSRLKYLVVCFCFLSAFLFAKNMYANFNFQSYKDWKFDMNTKNMLKELDRHIDKSKAIEEPVQLGVNWLFEPSVNFYRVTQSLEWLKPVTRDGLKENDRYVYTFLNDVDQVGNVIYTYETSQTVLYDNEK